MRGGVSCSSLSHTPPFSPCMLDIILFDLPELVSASSFRIVPPTPAPLGLLQHVLVLLYTWCGGLLCLFFYQVKECASRLVRLAKGSGITVFIVGHVTKSGSIAGPKVVEHMVDTVLYLEGDRFNSYRYRATLQTFQMQDLSSMSRSILDQPWGVAAGSETCLRSQSAVFCG